MTTSLEILNFRKLEKLIQGECKDCTKKVFVLISFAAALELAVQLQ